jgi:Divergent InlB B-repeat domain
MRNYFVAVVALALLLVGGTAATTSNTGWTLQSTLTVTLSGKGVVTSTQPGVKCPPDCSESFPKETKVTLTASADEGFVFTGWGGACQGTSGPTCDLTLDMDEAVEATFTRAAPPPTTTPTATGPTDTGPPPSTPPTSRPELGDSIDRALKKLRPANIAFNAPSTLRLGDSAVIQLLLSAQQPIRQLQDMITELGKKEGARIKVSNKMEAHLSGLNFKIQPITPEIQAVSEEEVTEWKWEIEATKTGTQRLHLTLSAFIDVEGQQASHTVRTFQRTLEIHVTWSDRMSGFIADNWQWLWTAILIPLVGWILHKRRAQSVPETKVNS